MFIIKVISLYFGKEDIFIANKLKSVNLNMAAW